MDEFERAAPVLQLSYDPAAGEIMVGTGGARKFRFRRPGIGKRGGYRVVTYYAGSDLPVFLLNLFMKVDRDNLSQAERNALRDILGKLADAYRKGAKQ